MSEAERQRRLHICNRLEELRWKYGTALEDKTLPEWLDTLEGFRAWQALVASPQPQEPHPTEKSPQTPPAQQPPQNRATGRSAEAWQRDDRWV